MVDLAVGVISLDFSREPRTNGPLVKPVMIGTKSFVLDAGLTKGMCFLTGRRLPASGIVSTPSRSSSRRMARHSQINFIEVLPQASHFYDDHAVN
jgi:hypothetical protein